ncbi:MAG TPA: hypothetical protein VGV92_07380 [Gammaproteobacteria bacterium]|nr:hypothetical protein [Gammaproteobacteria bacterium]
MQENNRLALPKGNNSDAWIEISRRLSLRDFAQLRAVCYALHENERLQEEFQRRQRIDWCENPINRSTKKVEMDIIWQYCLDQVTIVPDYQLKLKAILERLKARQQISANEEGWSPAFRMAFNLMCDDYIFLVSQRNALIDSLALLCSENIPTENPGQILAREEAIGTTRCIIRFGGLFIGTIFTGMGLVAIFTRSGAFWLGVGFSSAGGTALTATAVTEIATNHPMRNFCRAKYSSLSSCWRARFFEQPPQEVVNEVNEESPLIPDRTNSINNNNNK